MSVVRLFSLSDPRPEQIFIEIARPCRTRETGLIIPAGTIGRAVGLHVDNSGKFNRYHWLIDFGLATVVTLPYDSPLLVVLNGGER